ncbi:MAG: very short patch repair endonuclease [Actinomycetota bacterium]
MGSSRTDLFCPPKVVTVSNSKPKRGRKKPLLTKSEQMARVKSRNTALEVSLRKALWHRGARYRLRLKLPGSPDLAFISVRLVVFVDGCFWHGCPDHHTFPKANAEFWRNKLERNVARDRRVDQELAELGWQVVRVWGHEVEQDVNGVVERVLAQVTRRPGGSPSVDSFCETVTVASEAIPPFSEREDTRPSDTEAPVVEWRGEPSFDCGENLTKGG